LVLGTLTGVGRGHPSLAQEARAALLYPGGSEVPVDRSIRGGRDRWMICLSRSPWGRRWPSPIAPSRTATCLSLR